MKLDVFLVLLFSTLVLSSVGVSSSDIVETLLQKFDEGAELQKETVINIKEHSKKIDAFILNVEKQLVDIAKDIGIINTEKSEHLHRAIKRYESIKIILKDVRVALHRLASQTLYKVDDIVIYLDAWDSDIYSLEEKKIYLEEQIDLMNELLIDSDAILKKAKSKYDEAYEEFTDIEGNLMDFKRSVEIHLEEAEERAWSPSALTIILDIFGGLGVWTLTDYLVTKEQLEKELNHLRYTVEVAVEEVEEVMRNNAGLLSFIEVQTKKLVTWQESVKHVKKFLDKKDISEKIVNLRIHRKIFLKNLVELRTAANEFYELPDKILRTEILRKALQNPQKRKLEHVEKRRFLNIRVCIQNQIRKTIKECDEYTSKWN